MSKNAQGYMGIQIGKLGPAVGFMWKGRNVYRAYNPFARNPRTEKQLLQRARFALITKLARALSPAVNLGFSYLGKSERLPERSLFIKNNLHNVSGTTPENVSLSLDNTLSLSQGPVALVNFGNPSFDSASHLISVPVSDNAIGCALPSDEVLVFATNGIDVTLNDVDSLILLKGSANRSDNNVQLSVPASLTGTLSLYGIVRTTVQEATYIEDYAGYVYPDMASQTAYIGTVSLT